MKKEQLIILSDMEVVQSMKSMVNVIDENVSIDDKYQSLGCQLSKLDDETNLEYKTLFQYVESTKPSGIRLTNIWKVDRSEQVSANFKAFDDDKNRKLLWHGTKMAVVAAILKNGLKIMPHSGGSLGKGIYFASQLSKSASFSNDCNNRRFLVFLCEVVLGKEFSMVDGDRKISKDNLKDGIQSVVGRGRQEPNPKLNVKMDIDGRKVIVPQGEPVEMAKFSQSKFPNSEYVIYDESQCQIRYLCEFMPLK